MGIVQDIAEQRGRLMHEQSPIGLTREEIAAYRRSGVQGCHRCGRLADPKSRRLQLCTQCLKEELERRKRIKHEIEKAMRLEGKTFACEGVGKGWHGDKRGHIKAATEGRTRFEILPQGGKFVVKETHPGQLGFTVYGPFDSESEAKKIVKALRHLNRTTPKFEAKYKAVHRTNLIHWDAAGRAAANETVPDRARKIKYPTADSIIKVLLTERGYPEWEKKDPLRYSFQEWVQSVKWREFSSVSAANAYLESKRALAPSTWMSIGQRSYGVKVFCKDGQKFSYLYRVYQDVKPNILSGTCQGKYPLEEAMVEAARYANDKTFVPNSLYFFGVV